MHLRTILPLRFLCTAIALVGAGAANAHTEREAYSQFGESSIVHDGYGGCVRTGQWSEGKTLKECGGNAPMAEPKKVESAVPPPPPPPEPPAAKTEPAPPVESATVKPLADSGSPEVTSAAPPEPKAPPPVPAPVAAPASPVETMTLSAETLFDLNKADIKPGAKADLDDLAAKIRSKPVKSIVVTGHTDRTGSAKLNKRLSERRALSVRNYLVAKGIPAGVITAKGLGPSQPNTAADACNGLLKKELAACLQPDRRVEIAVTR